MNIDDVKKLFSGMAAIYDNDIEDKKSSISKIKNYLVKNHIPVATSNKVPSEDDIESLKKASFIILDWDFTNNNAGLTIEDGERIMGMSSLRDENTEQLIRFLKKFLDKAFVPVFIFTSLESEIDNIKQILIKE